MNTNVQTNTPSMKHLALRRIGSAAATATATAAIAMGLAATAASAQMAPAQPVPVAAPGVPVAAPTSRAASHHETVFRRIDADNNGFIIKSELDKADAKLGQDFQKYDTNGDGKLSLVEFEAMMKAMRG